MPNSKSRVTLFRLSLRAMLVLVAFVALAVTSLEYASDAWVAIAGAVTMSVCFAAFIIAFVDRGSRQAFAIGFSLVAISYWAVLIVGAQKAGSNSLELDFSFGRLPTTVLLKNLYSAVRKTYWKDPNTHQVIPGYDPATQNQERSGGKVLGTYSPGPYMANEPRREDFMVIGHFWWTLILGYVGGRFARWVYRGRCDEPSPSPSLL